MDTSALSTAVSVRALLLGERIDTRGLERGETIATNPLTLRIGRGGLAFLFRYGVAVFVGLSAIEEDEVIRSLGPRIREPMQLPETDQAQVLVKPSGEDQVDRRAPSCSLRLRLSGCRSSPMCSRKASSCRITKAASPMPSIRSSRSPSGCNAPEGLAVNRDSCCGRSAAFS